MAKQMPGAILCLNCNSLAALAFFACPLLLGCVDNVLPKTERVEQSRQKAATANSPLKSTNAVLPKAAQPSAHTAKSDPGANRSNPTVKTAEPKKAAKLSRGGEAPAVSHKLAIQLRERATKAAKQGNMEAAYTHALSGWEKVRRHKGDAKCRQLTAELLRQVEVYGEHISADSTAFSIDGKPLRYE